MQRGAYDYLTKPFDNDEVRLLAERALGARARARGRGAPDGDPGGVGVRRARGASSPMQEVYKTIGRIAGHRRDRSAARRVGDGQGGRGPRDPPLQPASGQAVRGRLLRGDSRRPSSSPSCSATSEGRSRTRSSAGSAARARPGRHDVLRRDRGHAARAAVEAPARPAGAAVRARRRRRADPHGRPRDRGHEP